MKFLVFGSLNIDFLYTVNHIVKPGETISSLSFSKSAGGKGANQAAALAKAGLTVYMAGKIGKDGRFLSERLSNFKVNTDNIIEYEGVTGHAIIQIDKNGQNSIVLYPGGNGEITAEEIQKTISEFDKGDMIILQNEISNIDIIMSYAKNLGMKICLNPSPFNEKTAALPLELTDIFFVNEIEGSSLARMSSSASPQDVLEKLIKIFPSAEIILTAGENGAYYGGGGIIEKEEIEKVPVVDTTAAGDTFTGYFLAARARNLSVKQSLAAACKASSITVSKKGAMESIPFSDEVFN